MLVKVEAYLFCESSNESCFGNACGLNWPLPSVILSTFIIDLFPFMPLVLCMIFVSLSIFLLFIYLSIYLSIYLLTDYGLQTVAF